MNNQIKILTVILMVVSIGFTSCSRRSNLSLIKRENSHENYIAKVKKAKAMPVIELETIVALEESKEIPVVSNHSPIQTPIVVNQNEATNETSSIVKDAGIDKTLFSVESKLKSYYPEFNETFTSNSQQSKAYENHQDFFLYIVLAIFLPPVCVGLWEGGFTTDFWIDLILTFCFWIPGVIFALYIILR